MLQFERLHIVSELSASVAHAIRNPLTVTNGFLQLLGKSSDIPEKEYIQYSLHELNQTEKIVGNFLNLAKPQVEYFVKSDFKSETEYVKNILEP